MNKAFYTQPVMPAGGGFHPHAPWSFHPGHHHGHHHGHQGFCPVCCHPAAMCCCGIRECRKEAKELLVEPNEKGKLVSALSRVNLLRFVKPAEAFEKEAPEGKGAEAENQAFIKMMEQISSLSREGGIGTGSAFIGGGCCVHLSIEFMPTVKVANTPLGVVVTVQDSENTILGWGKVIEAGSGYEIKECIISTNPGAKLRVDVVNVTARVRWCEVFSC
ncbi:MAG: hypothetical protein Kow0042_28950 [Calditrichia bacterium]